MELEELIIFIVTGGIAGWLASVILKKASFNLIGNIVVGIIGAFVGTALFDMLEIRIGNPYVDAVVSATIGAVILLLVLSFLQKKKR
jgi:uncharacterized membrane protein YeaQ/YmgE (transglycosylase-associated protein family)